MSELLPCPFCGGEAWLIPVKYDDGLRVCHVRCRSCYAAFDGTRDEKTAIEKWNRRAASEEWVSVEERLPLKPNEYLIASRTGYVTTLHYSDGWYCDTAGREYWDRFVTHWRPLPSPPKPASDAGGEK